MAKISTLIDDFQDNVIDTSKWVITGAAVEASGRAKLTPGAPTTFWRAATTYDLTSSQFTAEIPVVTPAGVTATLQSVMAVELDSNNGIAMRKYGTELLCSQEVGGVTTNLSFTPYSSVNHRFWRLRESAGNFYWETSATGSGVFFVQFTASIATLFPVNAITPYFQASFTGFEPSPGTFEIEAVNAGQQLTGAATSTSSGSAAISRVYALTGTASSTSAGSAAITIPPLTFHAIIGSGSSTSSGNASFITLAPNQVTAAGQSYSSGSVSIRITATLSGTAQSFSVGTAAFTIAAAPSSSPTQYFYFEPPIAYDLPATLPHPRPRYLNAHARWKGGQRRGRSVLKLNGIYQTIDTPTVDQTHAASEVYMGGHIYTIDNITADALSSAGYTVIPIPINWTLYPAEDVFPEVDLFPGYQELIPDRVAV